MNKWCYYHVLILHLVSDLEEPPKSVHSSVQSSLDSNSIALNCSGLLSIAKHGDIAFAGSVGLNSMFSLVHYWDRNLKELLLRRKLSISIQCQNNKFLLSIQKIDGLGWRTLLCKLMSSAEPNLPMLTMPLRRQGSGAWHRTTREHSFDEKSQTTTMHQKTPSAYFLWNQRLKEQSELPRYLSKYIFLCIWCTAT